MGFYQYFRDITRRHKNKVIIGAGVAVVSYLVGSYLSRKVNEIQERLKEENTTRDLIKKRFSQTQRDCYMTFLSFLPILLDPIYTDLNVESITMELRKAKSRKSSSPSDPQSDEALETSRSKVDLWNDLKIASLSRFFILVYSQALLIVLLHLQLNIISRKSYMRTAMKLASKQQGYEFNEEEETSSSLEKDLPEQAFLSLTWWILNKGWRNLKLTVESCVTSVFDNVDLRSEFSMEEFSDLIASVQLKINEKLNEARPLAELYQDKTLSSDVEVPSIVSLVLPPTSIYDHLIEQSNSVEFLNSFKSQPNNKSVLEKLVSELQDYLVSSTQITSLISSIAVSKVLLKTHTSINAKNELDKCKLALIIASLSSQTNDFGKDDELLLEMNHIEELDDLSASVYSNFNV